ncbi:MAG: hypothetical protein HKN23_11940, partial [Verrucomicrobiales bacterium]|nr:hypothetical protein [Verrucomicrobiales bacterium]
LDEAPFSVELEQPGIGLAKNAELDLKVKVQRSEGFEGALYLEMDWLPPGVTKQPPLIIPAGESTGSYKISATPQSKDGQYRLSISARENEGGNPRSGVGLHYIASPPIDVEVVDPYLEITLDRAAIEQGKTGKLIGTIKHLRPFEGVASAKLLRLPAGVTLMEQPEIKPGDESVTFVLQVAPDALTGQAKEIACDVAISEKGQIIHQQTGSGILRIDETRK